MAMKPIKLSELENSVMLVVRVGRRSQDGTVMTKEDFCLSKIIGPYNRSQICLASVTS